MGFDRRTLVLPPGTTFEERTIITSGDAVLGNHVRLAFGIKTDGRLFAGQGAAVEGDLECDGDLRMDQSCHVDGDLVAGANIFLGERCFVSGDLSLEGDLDVGDDVKIGGALHAKGWVNKRSPVPLVIYIFIYILEMLRLGQSEEVERVLRELDEAGDEDIAVAERFMFIPDGSDVGLSSSTIEGGLDAGDHCRILGNMTVDGPVVLGEGTQVYGALRASGDVRLARDCEVHGELASAGQVVVTDGCQVMGDLKARAVEMCPSASIEGKVIAEEGVTFSAEGSAEVTAKEKVQDLDSKSADLVDLLG